jgi:site-specific DNA recombinase
LQLRVNLLNGLQLRVNLPKLMPYKRESCQLKTALVLRAKLTLDLVPLAPELACADDLQMVLRRDLTVDLFEPPQREKFREQVVAARAARMPEWQIAAQLGITVTAAQRAAKLQRLMDENGLTDPYVPVTQPSADCARLRRYLHPRYDFQPLDNPSTP